MVLFFKDLQEASVVDFYRSVGAFGRSFLEAENEYLQNSLHYQNILNEGGLHDDSKIL